jgi:transcriptional regulator with XRE-family HTH domain
MELDREQILDVLRSKPRHERIVTLRSLYNLNQTGLAKIANVRRGTVSTWESPTVEADGGRGHEPGKMARSRMATFFNVPAYVFTDEWGDPGVARRRVPPPRKISDAGISVPAPIVKRIG